MTTQKEFFKRFIPFCMVMGAVFVMGDAYAAAVAKRGTVSRAQVAVRAPVAAKNVAPTAQEEPEEVIEEDVVVEESEPFEFEDRTSQFDDAIGTVATSVESADDELAEMIRRQRAAADASDATTAVKANVKKATGSGQNACDVGLRKCMQAKCGADFGKCAGDTDTIWGDKLDACRRDLKCSGHEYSLFVTEIKADRDANAELANFNAIINCGNKYNSCILAECGATFSKCLGKSEGDKAIAKCKKIQNDCVKLDGGLASRMMDVFAGVRQDAEKKIQRDEQRLYDLRDEMESVCSRMGAMFDTRSLDCVYTVNFFADNATTPYASKKAYAGGMFSCEPGWFGIDVTTFKENAYRLTRAQTAASSAMLGSGIGMAAGAITSGAIDRALETQKAKKELKEAQEGDKADKKADEKEKKGEPDNKDGNDDNKLGAAGRRCIKAGGNWENGACVGATCDDGEEWNSEKNKCVKNKGADEPEKSSEEDDKKDKEEESYEDVSASAMCDSADGKWDENNKKCKCKNANGKTINTKNPEECFIETEEEIIEEDDLDSAAVTCDYQGGKWENGTCSCTNAKGKKIKTLNPLNDCVKPSEAGSANGGEKSGAESAKDKKKVLSATQKKACTARDGTLNADATMCSCKDRNGRDIDTNNPINKCVKQNDSGQQNKNVAERKIDTAGQTVEEAAISQGPKSEIKSREDMDAERAAKNASQSE